jgi:hypothetical protein
MRQISGAGAVVLLCVLAFGCSSGASRTGSSVRPMGEAVQVGPLIYTVLDAEWFDQLGDPPNVRAPQQRFLTIRLSVTNSGSGTSGVPALRLEDSRGRTYEELINGEGLSDWLGYLRTVKAAQTERGRLLFDVPLGTYRLRLVNDADPENERVALVEIPLQLGSPVPTPANLPSTPQP